MDNSARLLVQTYVDGWREGDRAKILSCLDEQCVVIESYGPAYHGIVKVGHWIEKWEDRVAQGVSDDESFV